MILNSRITLKTAIASGELVGKKLSGDNSTTSVNQGNFVAENQTDFIFAVAGEEYGFYWMRDNCIATFWQLPLNVSG